MSSAVLKLNIVLFGKLMFGTLGTVLRENSFKLNDAPQDDKGKCEDRVLLARVKGETVGNPVNQPVALSINQRDNSNTGKGMQYMIVKLAVWKCKE